MLLDEKVVEWICEFEDSKKVVEVVNESKMFFIVNIFYELKMLLNGIMGMCVVLMEDNDMIRIK